MMFFNRDVFIIAVLLFFENSDAFEWRTRQKLRIRDALGRFRSFRSIMTSKVEVNWVELVGNLLQSVETMEERGAALTKTIYENKNMFDFTAGACMLCCPEDQTMVAEGNTAHKSISKKLSPRNILQNVEGNYIAEGNITINRNPR